MQFIERSQLKRRARERVLDQSYSVLAVSFIYLVLTDWISSLMDLLWTSPTSAITNQFYTSLDHFMKQVQATGSTAALDLSPVYSSTLDFARNLLSQPGQIIILFLFLLYYFYSMVAAFGYSFYALRTMRGQHLNAGALFDSLWLAGKIILLNLFTSIVTAVGLIFFLLPGVYFYYGSFMAPYVLMDNPDLSIWKALKTSFQITKGYKRQLLAAELSFLGWTFVSFLVLNIGYNIGVLFGSDLVATILSTLPYTVVMVYVLPYREMTFANFYESIRMPDLKV